MKLNTGRKSSERFKSVSRKFDNISFTLAIKNKMKLDNLTIREQEVNIGVPKCTISRVCNGKNPDIETAIRFCIWLGRSIDDFISYK